MSEVLLPPWIIPESETHEWLDEGSAVFNAAFAPGIAQRQSFGGLRLKLSRRHTVRAEEKAQLLSVLKATRGRFNALRTKVHFQTNGSGLGNEQLSNNTFANGTTGWSSYQSTSQLSSASRVLRITATKSGSTGFYNTTTLTSLVQFAPYVLRAMMIPGRVGGTSGNLRLGLTVGSDESIATVSFSASGLFSACGVPYDVSAATALVGGFSALTGFAAGDYYECSYVSLTRCPQVDNGSNLLLQSDDLTTTWANTNSTDSANSTTAPDGTSTADSLIEDATASAAHYIQQTVTVSSAVQDYAFSVALKANTRSWARILMIAGANSVNVYVNLSTGALGTGATGANWADRRAFVRDAGNGWYIVTIVGRKTSADTQITCRIGLATGDTVDTYSGDGSSSIYAWRATLAQSSVPTRLIQTTTTASTGTSQTGNALHVKGLPASTNGLFLAGDWFAINGELKQFSAAVNTDAAGIAYLQFEPPLVRSPADNDPVVTIDPMGKFLVSNIQIDNEFGTQAVVTYDLEHIYE